jgi:hypothetical protein
LQSNTHPNRQHQRREIRNDVENRLSIKVRLFVHTSPWDVEIPRAGDRRASKNRNAHGDEDIGYFEGSDGVDDAPEDTVWVDAEVEEEERKFNEEGTEVVGNVSAEVELERCEFGWIWSEWERGTLRNVMTSDILRFHTSTP